MLDNLIFSLNSTVPLFLIMLLGYFLKKKNFLSDGFIADANKLVFHVTLPVLLFLDMAQTDIRGAFDGPYVMYCAVVTTISILIIWLFARLFIRDRSLIGEFVQASYRSSAAILGVAFIQLIYGTAGMSGLMIIGCVPLYNIFAVLVLVLECPDKAGRDEHLPDKLKSSLLKIITNPIILGILIGSIFGFFRIPLCKMAVSGLDYVGRLTTPLALLAIGAGFKGREAVSEIKLTGIATAIKLVILPAVFLPLAVRCGFTGEKLVAILIMLGSITTPASYVMAKQMGHKGTLTASVCVCTTVFSSFTLTFWLFLASCLGWL
jgi:predicted permease